MPCDVPNGQILPQCNKAAVSCASLQGKPTVTAGQHTDVTQQPFIEQPGMQGLRSDSLQMVEHELSCNCNFMSIPKQMHVDSRTGVVIC